MMKHFAILCIILGIEYMGVLAKTMFGCLLCAHKRAGRKPNIAWGNQKWFFDWNGKFAGNFSSPYSFNNRKTKL